MSKNLFIVAGYSGVGKSTTINFCLKHQLPMFGNLVNPLFLTFQPSKIDGSWMVPVEDLLSSRQCIPGIYLEKLHEYPESILVHLDFLTLQVSIQGWPTGSEVKNLEKYFPRNFESFKDYEQNLTLFKHFLNADIFNSYEKKYVNTVIAPFEVVCDRWLKRSTNRPTVNYRNLFYEKNNNCLMIFNEMYRAWFDAIKFLEPKGNYVTKMNNANMKIVKYI